MRPSYDQANPDAIHAFARKLIGKSLADVADKGVVWSMGGNKGGFGQALETRYFGINPGNSRLPDFPEAGVELKSFPIKATRNGLVAKERLVLSIIDYLRVVDERWETSGLLAKGGRMLLVGFLHEKDKPFYKYLVKLVRMLELLKLPETDLRIIRDDWQKIVRKIRAGRAHELSEGDTLYLGACTKGADAGSVRRQARGGVMAKQRAFALKPPFLNSIIREEIPDAGRVVRRVGEYRKGETFEDLVSRRFDRYMGKTVRQIACEVGHRRRGSKADFADLARAMLGVHERRIEEFEKAGIVMKTIRLRASGMPKEDMSFRAFDYHALAEEAWEGSTLQEQLTRRFFFVIYRFDDTGDLRLSKVMFWSMPEDVLERDVHPVWVKTVRRIKAGRADDLPKKSESRVVHVRPHARNATDVLPAPGGKRVVKKGFWLNAGFIKGQIGT